MKKIVIVFSLLILLGSCTVVKEYEKVYINDPDMALESKKIHSYREAASGGNGGKTGGGCGCN